MSVQKKNGKWYAVVYLGIINGKQAYEWSEAFEKKKDAELKELELKKDVLERDHKVRPKESFGAIAEAWLRMKEKTVSKVTYTNYSNCYNLYIKDAFETTIVSRIESVDISNFMYNLDYKPATIQKIMSVLQQILGYAIELDYIKYNPANGIKKPNIRKTKKDTWSADVISDFLSHDDVKNSPIYPALVILFKTGMRPGEVCGLKWKNFDGESFVVDNGIAKGGGETELKNDKAHDPIYLSDDLISYLKKLRKLHKELYLSSGKQFAIDGYICCHCDDFRPFTPDYVYHTFQKLIKKIGYSDKKIRLYDARHSFGTNMMKNGVNPKMVADMMRHTDVKTTLNNYSHTDKEMYKDTTKIYKINIG
ncbi:MAG: site-specific integrase [Clostridiales bacterium]|nr:site-specific integrase [Clostridiales bacterium]